MNIVINFSTLKSGGGQNVAMNFLSGIEGFKSTGIKITYWVADGSEPHNFLIEKHENNFLVLPGNPLKRIIAELILSRFWLRSRSIDLVYSYFGFAWIPRNVKQVVGAADSNLFFPEIDFWKSDKGFRRLKRYLVDEYRKFGLRRANHVIFENVSMMERAESLLGLVNTSYVKPSIIYGNSALNFDYPKLDARLVTGLFLCGWHTNKNVLIIPRLIKACAVRGVKLTINFSASYDGSPLSNEFEEIVDELGVRDSINMMGSIAKEDLPSVYKASDVVFLLSALESFSNNIIEAWTFKRFLIISDEEWSRSICDSAAIYVSRNDPSKIASELLGLIQEKRIRTKVEYAAEEALVSYPSIYERINAELQLIKSLVRKG